MATILFQIADAFRHFLFHKTKGKPIKVHLLFWMDSSQRLSRRNVVINPFYILLIIWRRTQRIVIDNVSIWFHIHYWICLLSILEWQNKFDLFLCIWYYTQGGRKSILRLKDKISFIICDTWFIMFLITPFHVQSCLFLICLIQKFFLLQLMHLMVNCVTCFISLNNSLLEYSHLSMVFNTKL